MWTLYDPRIESGGESPLRSAKSSVSPNEKGHGARSTAEQLLFLMENIGNTRNNAETCCISRSR